MDGMVPNVGVPNCSQPHPLVKEKGLKECCALSIKTTYTLIGKSPRWCVLIQPWGCITITNQVNVLYKICRYNLRQYHEVPSTNECVNTRKLRDCDNTIISFSSNSICTFQINNSTITLPDAAHF